MCITGDLEPVTNRFSVFPVSIWEVILEKVENSEDIRNVITAFPELKSLADEKQFSWLIDKIMPLIFPKYVAAKDIKSCRLASKRWKNSVGTCLERHPDRQPYKSPKSPEIITETHFNYHKLPFIISDFPWFFLTQSWENLRMQEEMGHNPFPGRNVEITVKGYRDNYHDRWFEYLNPSTHHPPHKLGVELSEVVPVLKMFGHHIWHITFRFPFIGLLDGELLIKQILEPLFQSLSCLPNLKSLKLARLGFPPRDMSHETRKKVMEFISAVKFPFHLETIDLSLDDLYLSHEAGYSNDINRSFMTALANHNQVKKLVTVSAWWKTYYAYMFPNLCELSLRTGDKTSLRKILQDLRFAPIRKFELEVLGSGLYLEDILEVLVPYKIEFLELHGGVRVETDHKKPRVRSTSSITRIRKSIPSFLSARLSSSRSYKKTVTSIRYLKIVVAPQLAFTFFKWLPGLQYLTLEIDNLEWDEYKEDNGGEDVIPNDKFSTCLHNLYYKGEDEPENLEFIWDQLPNLKMITVHIERHQNRYVREYRNCVFHSRHRRPII